MRKYIATLKEKPEHVRKQALMVAMAVCMTIVGSVWMYSLGTSFGSTNVVAQTAEEVKPLTLFGSSLKNTYKNMVASVGNAPVVGDSATEVVPITPINNQ